MVDIPGTATQDTEGNTVPPPPPNPTSANTLPFGNTDQPNAFTNLPDPQETPSDKPSLDPQQTNRTARLGAIAQSAGTPYDGLMSQIEQVTKTNQETIAIYGETALRNQIAAQQQVDSVNTLLKLNAAAPNLDPTGELERGTLVATQQAINQSVAERAQSALEVEAVKRIQTIAQTDPVQAQVAANAIQDHGAESIISDMNAKHLILQHAIQNAQIAKDDQPWFMDLADWVTGQIPFHATLKDLDSYTNPNIIKSWYDGLFPGNRDIAQADSFATLSPAEYAKAMPDVMASIQKHSSFLGMHNHTDELNLLTQLDRPMGAFQRNAFGTLDNFGLLLGSESVWKGVAALPTLLVKNGARAEAGALVTRAFEATADMGSTAASEATGVATEDITSNLLHTGMNPDAATTRVSLATDANTNISRNQALRDTLPDLVQPGRFTNEAERQAAITANVNRITTEFDRPLKDVNVITSKLANGSQTTQLEITQGKASGGGFQSEALAQRRASSLGYGDSANISQDESGQWWVKTTHDLNETGFYTNELNIKSSSFIQRYVNSAAELSDDVLFNQATTSNNQRNRLVKGLLDNYQSTFRALKGDERTTLAQILAKGTTDQVWLDDDRLAEIYQRVTGKPPSQRVIDGYHAARDANDVDHILRNDDLYLGKSVKGYQTASLDTGIGKIDREDAIVDRGLKVEPGERIYNATEHTHYNSANPITPQELERLKGEGYVRIQLENPKLLADGTTVDSFMAKGRDIQLEPLKRDQLPYAEGGHRIYKDKNFVKQAVYGTQPDTGEKFLTNPSTYITGSASQTKDWATRMEAARNALVNNNADAGTLDTILGGGTGLPDGQKFIDRMEGGMYQKETPFEALYDREMPTHYQGNKNIPFLGDQEELPNASQARVGRLFYSSKGDQLLDYNGELAATLDPFEAINQSLKNVASMSTFSDYKLSAIERWSRQFRGFLNPLPEGSTDLHILDQGAFARDTPSRIAQQGEIQRDIIKRTLQWRTDFDRQAEQQVRNIGQWVEGDNPASLRANAANYIGNWWNNSSPVNAVRGLAYDLTLGLFNVSRLPIHAAQMVSALALNPKEGLNGMMTLFPLRTYLTKSGTEGFLDHMVDRGIAKLSGFDNPEDFKAMMRGAKNSGFFDQHDAHGLINAGYGGPNVVVGQFGDKFDQFRQAGRFFSNEGIIWNQAVAWHVAWKEAVNASPGLATDSPELLAKVQGLAERYSQNMSNTSAAWWQRGILSVPTQFWSYNTRMLEAMFGNQFTMTQKARLVTAHTLLYGSAGVPGASWVTSMLNAHSGSNPDIHTFWGTAERGLVDKTINSMTGADVQAGERFGSGAFLTNQVRDILDQGTFGPKSVATLAGGVGGSVAMNVGGSLFNLAKYGIAERGGDTGRPLSAEALNGLAKNIASVSLGEKAYHIFKYGTLVSNKGTVVATGLPSSDGFAMMLLGAQPEQADMSAMMGYLNNEKEAIKSAQKTMSNYRNQMATEPDRAEDIENEINAYTRTLPPSVAAKALNGMRHASPPSLYDSLAQRVSKEQAQAAFLDNQEPNK